MNEPWRPSNKGGKIFYDPKDELKYWVERAQGDPMVAVPVTTLIAVIHRQECSARKMINTDEDGPVIPREIVCRLTSLHKEHGIDMHYNGYMHWSD